MINLINQKKPLACARGFFINLVITKIYANWIRKEELERWV